MLLQVEAARSAHQVNIKATPASSNAESATLDASHRTQVLKAVRVVHPVRIRHVQELRRAEPALVARGLPEAKDLANSATKGIMPKLEVNHAPSVALATSQA